MNRKVSDMDPGPEVDNKKFKSATNLLIMGSVISKESNMIETNKHITTGKYNEDTKNNNNLSKVIPLGDIYVSIYIIIILFIIIAII